ncbi:MAG: DUF779 domain-containing protein [Saprospirales bacterium]|nr:MAG: DUF779 domain-containing protein [Saprospirales bacterium]
MSSVKVKYIPRVLATAEAKVLINQLRSQYGELIFHQSGGCCDGSAPMCFEKGDFLVGDSDLWIGNVHGCDFFMSADQFEYWKHTQLTIDLTRGVGSSFSLEIPLGVRFIIRSRIFEPDEMNKLVPVRRGDDLQ